MKVPQLAHGYPSEARSSFLQNLQIMASRSRSCWAISFTFSRPERREDGEKGRSAESTSGSAFHNAPGALKPAGHSVRPGLLPTVGHGGQSSLLPLALEAEPTVAVFTGDGNRSAEWSAPPLRCATAVQLANIWSVCGPARRGPAIDPSSLGRGRRDLPHFPPSARRVEKRPITHRQFLRSRMVRRACAHQFIKQGGCQNRSG